MKIFYRLTTSLLTLVLFTFNVSAQVAEKQTVALLEFEGRGISQLEAKTLTDRLMSEMVNTDAVIMVERNQMDEILNEQGFQQSGCTSSECAAEVGALLGVQNMVSVHLVNLVIPIQLMQRCSQWKQVQRFVQLVKHIKVLWITCLPLSKLLVEIVGLKAPQDKLDILAAADPALAASPKKSGGGKTLRRLMWTTLLLGGGAAAYLLQLLKIQYPYQSRPFCQEGLTNEIFILFTL